MICVQEIGNGGLRGLRGYDLSMENFTLLKCFKRLYGVGE